VKAKNRFANPTLTGYRDFNMHIQIDVDGVDGNGNFKHICEIQVHHMAIRALDKELGAHKLYESFRKYFAGATASLQNRLDDLLLISDGKALDDALLNKLLADKDEDRLERLADLSKEQLCEHHWALCVLAHLLHIRKTTLGEDHTSVGDTYHSMANVYHQQGKLDEAIKLYNKSLKIKKKNLGEDHTLVADTYNNMAIVYVQQGKIDEAMKLNSKSLEI